MRSSLDDIFISNLPTLDLHGETKDSYRVLLNEFIYDNYFLKNEKIVVVHGKGKGILKEEVRKVLKMSKYVLDFHINNYNDGCTLIYLKKK